MSNECAGVDCPHRMRRHPRARLLQRRSGSHSSKPYHCKDDVTREIGCDNRLFWRQHEQTCAQLCTISCTLKVLPSPTFAEPNPSLVILLRDRIRRPVAFGFIILPQLSLDRRCVAQCVQRAVHSHSHCRFPNIFLLRCAIRGEMASKAYTVTDAHAKVNERQFSCCADRKPFARRWIAKTTAVALGSCHRLVAPGRGGSGGDSARMCYYWFLLR